MVTLRQLMPLLLNPLLSPSRRTTASLTLITSPNLLRRSLPLVLVFLKLVSRMRVASKTRNEPTPNLSLRKKRKTSLLVLEARPSVSASASRSNFLRLISASSKPPSVDEVDSAVAEAVVMDHLEEAEVKDSVVDAVVKVEEVAHVAITEAAVVLLAQEAAPDLPPSTQKTPAPSPAWDHKSRPKVSNDLHPTGANTLGASLQTNDRAKRVIGCNG